MELGLIINVVALVVQLLDLIRDSCKDGWAGSSKRLKHCQAELTLFRTQLHDKLHFANKIQEQALAAGFMPESLEKLQNELQEFVSSAKDLLSSKNCNKKDIQQLRELAMGTLQYRMECIVIEMCIKSSEDLKAIKEMMAKQHDKQEMVSKNSGVHINIFQGGNPMLTELLSFVIDTSRECVSKVLADEYLNPIEASKDKAGPYVPLVRVADVGMIKGVEESGMIQEGAAEYVPKEEEEKVFLTKEEARNDVLVEEKRREEALVKDMQRPSAAKYVPKEEEEQTKKKKEAFLTKEGAGMDEADKRNKKKKEAFLTKGARMDVLEEENKKRKEAPLLKDKERLGQQTTELNDKEEQDNPNRNMQLTIEKDIGELIVSEYKGSQWKVTYKWHEESMGMVIGNIPMEVSKKLGYFYFEVKLVEMAELLTGRETRLAGVGVGVARSKKFRLDKMTGKYSKSCGYDGRVGEVYYEGRVQGDYSMGYLAKGDTVGIGILQHNDQHCIFFTLNGDLRVCIQDDSLCTPSSHGGLLPVISLASAHVQVHVNFRGPFQLSDLLAQVKATLRHK